MQQRAEGAEAVGGRFIPAVADAVVAGSLRYPHLHAHGEQLQGRGAAFVMRTVGRGGRIRRLHGGAACSPWSSPSICPAEF